MPDQFHRPIVPITPARVRTAGGGLAPVWWVGVDGGGSGTRVVLAGPDGGVRGRGQAGASALGRGVDAAWDAIARAVAQACGEAGVDVPAWSKCALGAGLSGVNVPVWADEFVATAPTDLHGLVLEGDGFTALLGAHGGEPGALVVSGTGSVAEALHADGRRLHAGGWGWQCGDEGSGAWLGREALRHAQRAADGRDPSSLLARAVAASLDPHEGLQQFALGAGQAEYAALAPKVFDAAEAGDAWADALLGRAAHELGALVDAVDPAGTLPLALGGSIAARLAPRLAPSARARIRAPLADAASGALWLARRTLAAA
jgi:glucosamine kinase